MTSTLAIPSETDVMVVRIFNGAEVLQEPPIRTLGDIDRDAWPLTQQIVRGAKTPDAITIAVELRKNDPGGSLLLVGYAAIDAELPATGEATIDLFVARACDDQDGDEHGIGSGCRGPDCDDGEATHPIPTACPPAPDAGIADGGNLRPDAGPQPDGGVDRPVLCGPAQDRCADDEACVRNYCRKRCTNSRECPGPEYTCSPQLEVCFCNFPCDGDERCRPYMCIDGCCRI